MRQLVYTRFITNNLVSFHLWWKENLVKYQKVSKFYENDCSYHINDNNGGILEMINFKTTIKLKHHYRNFLFKIDLRKREVDFKQKIIQIIRRNQVYFSSSNWYNSHCQWLDVEWKVYILFQNCYQLEPN